MRGGAGGPGGPAAPAAVVAVPGAEAAEPATEAAVPHFEAPAVQFPRVVAVGAARVSRRGPAHGAAGRPPRRSRRVHPLRRCAAR